MSLKRWYGFFCTKCLLVAVCESFLSKNPCLEGYILPQEDDIAVEYGNSLDLSCIMVNTTYKNANLSFTRNGKQISPETIDVINSTVIKIHIKKPPLVSGDLYTCLLDNQTSLCMKRLSVGTKPQRVRDFSCISYNYDNLTCTWTSPQNFVPTDYSLTFTLLQGRAVRYTYPCPYILSDANSRKSCFWNESTTPPYRVLRGKYNNFTLKMKNTFGQNQVNKAFNHFAHVLPGPPENLIAESTTSSSVYLSWDVPTSMQTFPPGVHHRILYQCEYGKKQWNHGGMLTHVKDPRRKAYFNLTNLPYAYALCDIKVSLRSAEALPSDETMWSRNASITVRTSSKIPDEPPLTNVGSFEIVSVGEVYRKVYIYWKQIREEQKNGLSFNYEISCEQNKRLRSTKSTNTYAMFDFLELNKSYTFNVWSENVNGSSIRRSIVHVPQETDRVKKPRKFTKVAFDEGYIEMTWEAPILRPNEYITNYTIFQCINDKDRPHQCNGLLNWRVVSNVTTTINREVNKNEVFQFAISANTEGSSSGMLWADCTMTPDKYMDKLKTFYTQRVSTTLIEVGWKLDCTHRIDTVEGYVIYFCPVSSAFNTECIAPQANTTFYESTTSSGNITDLTPYTTYMLSVSVITKYNIISEQSDHVYSLTDEAAPSSPHKLIAVNVTRSTITVNWQPPQVRNGVLKDYEVKLTSRNPNTYQYKSSEDTTWTFTGLQSYVNYTISVKACTTECSKEATITVFTPMSRPNKIDKPTIARRKGSSITIVWNKPSEPGGKNDIYVVRLRRKDDNKISEYNTTDRSYVLSNCDNSDKDTTFYISVKAVNKMKENYLDGPWSLELKTDCHLPINYIMYLLLVIVIAPVISTSFLSKRLYHRFKIMKDVEVELPPGLASMVAENTFLSDGSIDTQKEKCGSHSSPYEELPLVKISESSHLSGCNTGHKNVTFSLELETHIFSSSGVSIEQPDSHCVCSVNTEVINPSSTPVSVEADVPSPHITTTSEKPTVKPGYVSFNQTEPIQKKPGYVVSEIKNVNRCTDPLYMLASVDSKVAYNICNDADDAIPYITTSETQTYIPFKQIESIQKNSGYVISEINNVIRCIYSSNIPATVDAKVPCKKCNDLNDSTPYVTINEAHTINSAYVPSNQTESIQKNEGYVASEINTASACIDSSYIPVPVNEKVPCKKCNDSNDTPHVTINEAQTKNSGYVLINQAEPVQKNLSNMIFEINNPSVCIDSSNIPVPVDVKVSYKKCNDSNDSTPCVKNNGEQTTNLGYVPINQTESVQKNSGYVISEIKNVSGCIDSPNIPDSLDAKVPYMRCNDSNNSTPYITTIEAQTLNSVYVPFNQTEPAQENLNGCIDSSIISAPADAKVPYKRDSYSNDWVTTNESQTINSGYVPFNQTEPVQENSGYVVSEIKNVRDCIPFNQADSVSANRSENTKDM